ISVLVIAAIIFIQEGQRRIPVQYAKRVRGTRMYSGGSTHIPLRVNSAGVIPIIFAISILLLPSQIAQYFTTSETQLIRDVATSILIVVGVVVETMKLLEAQLLQRSYEGFIR